MWQKQRRVTQISLPPSTKCTTSNCFLIAVSFFILALKIDGVVGEDSDSYNEDAEEKQRVHDVIVEEWFDLVRYLVGLGLCIFGLVGMYFHQFASYHFVKQYSRPTNTEHRVGRVLTCKPLAVCASETRRKQYRKKNRKAPKVASVLPKSKTGVKAEGYASSITDYVREEDIERQRQQLGMECASSEQQHTDYRMLVVYTVPKESPNSPMCCNPIENEMVINCANSFSVNSCAPDILEIEEVETYRSRSLPPNRKEGQNYKQLKGSTTSSYIPRNDDTEYFRWFQTTNPKAIDSDIDLILLKGEPKSACTPELIESHLEQIRIRGKTKSDKRKYYKSVSMVGIALVVTIIVLALVCVVKVLSMPNPETQRPIGFTVLGVYFVMSIASAYLFAKLRFEQYKQDVFLSAFSVPLVDRPQATDRNVDANANLRRNASDGADDSIALNSIRHHFPSRTEERLLS